MSPIHRKILIDLERLKYPFTGLYAFSEYLAQALIQIRKKDQELTFFVPKKFKSSFGAEVQYLIQSPIQKWYFPNTSKFDSWHSAYQGSPYYPRNNSTKIIQTVHDLNFLYEKQDKPDKIKKYLQKIQKGLDRAEVITTISEFTMRELETHLILKNQKKKVVYNGCQVTSFPDFHNPLYIPKKPYLFSIGTVLPKKNFHVLPALLKDNDWELIIAGLKENPYQEKIWEEADKFGVRNRVKLLGAINEPNKYWYYKNCAAFVFPSLAEGFGIPVIEAMRYGKPIFLSDKTSLPEIGGDLAYYFQSFDPESMTEVLEKGLNSFNPNVDSLNLIHRSRLFTWEKSAQDYLELY